MHFIASVFFSVINAWLLKAESTYTTPCDIAVENYEALVKKLDPLFEKDSGVNIIEYVFTFPNTTDTLDGRWYRSKKLGSSHLIYAYEYFTKILHLSFPITKIQVQIDTASTQCLQNISRSEQEKAISQYLLQDFNIKSVEYYHNAMDIVHICKVNIEHSLQFFFERDFTYRCSYYDGDPEPEYRDLYKDDWMRGLKFVIRYACLLTPIYYLYFIYLEHSNQNVEAMSSTSPTKDNRNSTVAHDQTSVNRNVDATTRTSPTKDNSNTTAAQDQTSVNQNVDDMTRTSPTKDNSNTTIDQHITLKNSQLVWTDGESLSVRGFLLVDNITYLIMIKEWKKRNCMFWIITNCGGFIEITPLLIPFLPIILEFPYNFESWLTFVLCSLVALVISIRLNTCKMSKNCTKLIYFSILCLIGAGFWFLLAPFLVLASVLVTIDTEQQSRGIIILLIVFVLYARETFSRIRNKFARFLGEIMHRIQQNQLERKKDAEDIMYYDEMKLPCISKDFFFFCCSIDYPCAPGSILWNYLKGLVESLIFGVFLLLVFFLMMSYNSVYKESPINQSFMAFLYSSLPLIAKKLFSKGDSFKVNYNGLMKKLNESMTKFDDRKEPPPKKECCHECV